MEKLQNNLNKAIEELVKEYNVNYRIENNRVSFDKDGIFLTAAYINNKKLEVRDLESDRFKNLASYNKIKEILKSNIRYMLKEIKDKMLGKDLQEKIESIDYIVENYNIYVYENEVTLTPKDYKKIFTIKVINWSDQGIKTYLNFKNGKISFEDFDKIEEAKIEFKKINEIFA